jgi:hypothetical protein
MRLGVAFIGAAAFAGCSRAAMEIGSQWDKISEVEPGRSQDRVNLWPLY